MIKLIKPKVLKREDKVTTVSLSWDEKGFTGNVILK